MIKLSRLVYLLLALSAASIAQAIEIGLGTTDVFTFDNQPAAADWAGGTIAGGSSGATDITSLDLAVNGITQAAVSNLLAPNDSGIPSQNGAPRWNTVNRYIDSNTTGTIAGLL